MFVLNRGAVSSKSSKQDVVTDSTIEARYVVASKAVKESIWTRNFLMDLGVVQKTSNPLELYCEISSACQETKAAPYDQAYLETVSPNLKIL